MNVGLGELLEEISGRVHKVLQNETLGARLLTSGTWLERITPESMARPGAALVLARSRALAERHTISSGAALCGGSMRRAKG